MELDVEGAVADEAAGAEGAAALASAVADAAWPPHAANVAEKKTNTARVALVNLMGSSRPSESHVSSDDDTIHMTNT